MGRGPAPTRQNLIGLERRLERVAKGTALLRRKREALVAELFRLARPAATARVSIAERAATAYPLLLGADSHFFRYRAFFRCFQYKCLSQFLN